MHGDDDGKNDDDGDNAVVTKHMLATSIPNLMQVSTPNSNSTMSMSATSRCVAVCTKANTTLVKAPPVLALQMDIPCQEYMSQAGR